jgi:hypothetical protein
MQINIEIRLQAPALTLAEELNFTRAAERLRITQPALSKQIVEFESRLGFPVFIVVKSASNSPMPGRYSFEAAGMRMPSLRERFNFGVSESGDGPLALALAMGGAPASEQVLYLDRRSILAQAWTEFMVLRCTGWFERATFALG